MSSMEPRRSELLADVEDCVSDHLKRQGIESAAADDAAAGVADMLADNWAGQNLVFPGDYAFKRAKRDAQIRERAKAGESVASLASAFGLGERAVRKAIARQHTPRRRS